MKIEKPERLPDHKYAIRQIKHYFRHSDLHSSLTMDEGIFRTQIAMGKKHGIFVPRVLLVDPTEACNLRCTGCWAEGYAKDGHLSFETLERIITEAENLGIKYIFYSGGEPLMRKEDLLCLCKSHPKIVFFAYTNGTMVDEAFVLALKEVGNFSLFLSIDGFKEQTDQRRGAGVFDQVTHAMDLLREQQIAFGFSSCYHSGNWDEVTGKPFLSFLKDKGCSFGWLFTYIPIGKNADMGLVCTAEQRAEAARRTAVFSDAEEMLIIDFWNNGHLAAGCVGSGLGFVHINAHGDVEPCAFSHYSDRNIHDVSLIEALRSPLFRQYQQGQPFDKNPYRSCPLIDHPEKIRQMVETSGAHATEKVDAESVQEFSEKMAPVALDWVKEAEKLYKEMPRKEKRSFRINRFFMNYRKKRFHWHKPTFPAKPTLK